MKKVIALLLAAAMVFGCAGITRQDIGKNMVAVAATAPALAYQFNDIYAYMVAQKSVPGHSEEATRVLAAMDAIAPLVGSNGELLQGDNFNWAQFIVQSAMIAAITYGYVATVTK